MPRRLFLRRCWIGWLGIACLYAGLLTGCVDTGGVLAVDLLTDYTPGVDFDRVELTVRADEEDSARMFSHAVFGDGGRTRIAEVDALPVGDWLLSATLLSGDQPVGEGHVLVGFDGTTRVVTVLVSRACAEVRCGDGSSTCRGGECVDPRCAPETPEFCPEPRCEADLDCGSPLTCVEARCLAGFCSVSTRPERCEAAERCTTEGGCVPRCDGFEPSCSGGVSSTCEPTTGQTVERSCEFGCDAAAEGCRPSGISNFAALGFDPDGPDVLIEDTRSFDTTVCDDTLGPAIVADQPGGAEACVVRASRFTIADGATVTVRGSRPLAVLASERIDVAGRLVVAAEREGPGPGGYAGADADTLDGGGPEGGTGGGAAGFEGGGGGGGGFCGRGARGGAGANAEGGEGSSAVTTGYSLEPLRGGSGGGGGPGYHENRQNFGLGGHGGGAVQLTAGQRIDLSGVIWAYGGYGRSGTDYGASNQPVINRASGGGGGAGGGVLLEAPIVEVQPSSRVAASGGGGGAGCGTEACGTSGSQGSGGPRSGGHSAMGEGGSDGGRSGGADTPDGEPGMDVPAAGAMSGEANGGGGGGGAGCIAIRTTVAPTVPPQWSPSEGHGLTVLLMHGPQ